MTLPDPTEVRSLATQARENAATKAKEAEDAKRRRHEANRQRALAKIPAILEAISEQILKVANGGHDRLSHTLFHRVQIESHEYTNEQEPVAKALVEQFQDSGYKAEFAAIPVKKGQTGVSAVREMNVVLLIDWSAA